MAETTYVSVVWTTGDIITEAKLDNMVSNDQSVDAHAQGIEFAERADPSTPAANKVHLYAKDKDGIPTLYAIDDSGDTYVIDESRPALFTSIIGTLIAGTNQTPLLIAPRALTIVKAYARVKTAPTGANLIIDINKNGTSIWNATQANRLTITAGNSTGEQTSFDVNELAEDDYLTVDLDQVGSTVAGADITIYLRCVH